VVGNSPICPAKTCSEAQARCKHRCSSERERCNHCNTEFSSCLQTGVFEGNVCHLSGLARR
jgi:hypothetical protein